MLDFSQLLAFLLAHRGKIFRFLIVVGVELCI